jgi:hypothetical protein
MINEMAVTNGEAAEDAKELLDDAFDAFTNLPAAAARFADVTKNTGGIAEDWPKLVIEHLTQAKKLLDELCGLSLNDGRLTVSKVAILQRYLPSLARLCYKVSVFATFLCKLKSSYITYTWFILSMAAS